LPRRSFPQFFAVFPFLFRHHVEKTERITYPDGDNFSFESEKVQANPAFPVDSPAQRRIGQAIHTPLD
jgi:hypothetical protein